ncbi:MAG TPA: MarR family transcriptional regulator [Candidatus Thermoplasmatota archaeon]|jgi:predicted transcriptional regulator|nr:MarR family transcriptional regulator [Candidatus Thermoplasmatota archaeon]
MQDLGDVEEDTRARMVARLREQPGLHLRALARELDMTPQNASYHLRQLLAEERVREARVGARRCFFAAGHGRAARAAMADQLAAQGAQRERVLLAVLAAPGIHQAAIARELRVEPTSVRHAVRGLLAAGLVEEQAEDGRRGYVPTARASALRLGGPP